MAFLGVALVTGAGGGIGRAIALRLAKDGFHIALNDIHASLPKIEAVRQEVSKFGRKTSVLTANVAHEKEVSKMVDQAVRDLGGLDVMVANAGILRADGILDASNESWDQHLAVNAKGVLFCFKYGAKQMITQGRGGRLLAAASTSGMQGNLGPAVPLAAPWIEATVSAAEGTRGTSPCSLSMQIHDILGLACATVRAWKSPGRVSQTPNAGLLAFRELRSVCVAISDLYSSTKVGNKVTKPTPNHVPAL